MKKRISLLLGFVLSIVSCIDQDASNQHGKHGEKQTVVQHIRTDTTNRWSHIHNVRQLSKQLELPAVENGFDSLQIRIWFDHSLAYDKHLITLERQKKSWHGWLYEMKVSYVDTLNYNIIDRYTKKETEPESGWKQLFNKLNQLKIRDLSNTGQSGTDGMTYCVEILTQDSYTYYEFWEPDYTKTNGEAENMVKIIALLETEFKIKVR